MEKYHINRKIREHENKTKKPFIITTDTSHQRLGRGVPNFEKAVVIGNTEMNIQKYSTKSDIKNAGEPQLVKEDFKRVTFHNRCP